MNVFVLDMDLRKCAEYHTDKHVVKMITETAQLLSSAYYSTNEEMLAPYKLSHKFHPWSIWARESLDNWLWLEKLGICLYAEYKYRYHNRTHKAGTALIQMSVNIPNLVSNGMTKMPLCMPFECKTEGVVESYRNYYNMYKRHLFKWTGRKVPEWISVRTQPHDK